MTKKSFALFLLVLALTASGFSQAASQPAVQAPAKALDVAGVWELTMQTPQGEMTRDATFTQEKDAIKVTMEGPMGEMKGEGTVKESEVTWTMTISTPNGDFALVFKAKVEGDKMTGEIAMGDMGTSTFSATKKKK
jgi:hypothetical protein